MAKAHGGNEGQQGDESVRIGGKPLSELGVRERQEAQLQIDERNRRERHRAILAKYPKYKVEALQGQLKQCERNLVRMRGVVAQEESTIAEYKMWIRQCEQRDRELIAAGLEPK